MEETLPVLTTVLRISSLMENIQTRTEEDLSEQSCRNLFWAIIILFRNEDLGRVCGSVPGRLGLSCSVDPP